MTGMMSTRNHQARAPIEGAWRWFFLLCALGTTWMWANFTLPLLASQRASMLRINSCLQGCPHEAEKLMVPKEFPVKIDAPRDPCSGYDGVLRIRSGDAGAAAGTVFYIYMANHLIYAEMHNLLPWIHLDNTSHRIYDPKVHGVGSQLLRMHTGDIPSDEETHPLDPTPLSVEKLEREDLKINFTLTGNGVWDSYFEPVSEFSPSLNRTCWTNKPLYEIHYNQIVLGLHGGVDWGIRAWPYGKIGDEQKKLTVREWYRPMRRRAASMVRRYIRPKAWLKEAADKLNPLKGDQQCMAMHVRTTDKGLSGGRAEVSLDQYLPHAESFLEKFGANSTLFLATDSSQTLENIKKEWPSNISGRVRSQESAVRSSSKDPTFDIASHDRTNREVLAEIYAMAKCKFMIHGRSAVSESVLYINPDMREASVDLEGDIRLME